MGSSRGFLELGLVFAAGLTVARLALPFAAGAEAGGGASAAKLVSLPDLLDLGIAKLDFFSPAAGAVVGFLIVGPFFPGAPFSAREAEAGLGFFSAGALGAVMTAFSANSLTYFIYI